MDAQDLLPPVQVRPIDRHLPVEAAWPQQRGIQDLGPVGGGQENDALLRIEPVHLRQELVQRLLAFVVAPHHGAHAARLADGVQLVDEDDARRLVLGLREHVADPRGADADEHLDEVRAAEAEERHPGFSGDRLGEQCLPGAGRPDEQDTFRDPSSETLIPLGLLEKVHDLHQLAARFVDARHVVEGHAGAVLDVDLGLALSDGEKAALRVAHPPHHERPQPDEHQRGHDPREQGREPGVLHAPGEGHVRRFELGDEAWIVDARSDEPVHAPAVALQLVDLLFGKQSLQPVGRKRAGDDLLADHEATDLVLRDERLELAVREIFHVRGEQERLDQEHDEKGGDEIPGGEALLFGLHR